MKKALLNLIDSQISSVFDKAKAQLLGPNRITKSIILSYKDLNPSINLIQAYLDALLGNSVDPSHISPKTVKMLADRSELYIDAAKDKAVADLSKEVTNIIDAHDTNNKITGNEDASALFEKVKQTITDAKDKIKKHMDMITETEIANAQNYGAFDGILGAAKASGMEDPTVFKIPVTDTALCKTCKDLWLLPGSTIPRVYKLSELKADNPDHKNPVASISTTHPFCRCHLSILGIGFGYDSSGNVEYKGKMSDGTFWDEYKHQRGF